MAPSRRRRFFRKDESSTQAKAQPLPITTAVPDHIGGAIGDITFALLAITIPMSVLTVVFGALVARYRLPSSLNHSGNLASSIDAYDSGSYYVDYSATRLITVSSWISTTTSLVSSFAAALLAYPIACKYMQSSQKLQPQKLLSPYQLRLVIGLLGGGLGSLWSWFLYCFWKKRSKQATILQVSALGSLVVTTLGYAIFAADTWLHVTTSTVLYDKIQTILTPASSFGRGLSSVCFVDNEAGVIQDPCTNAALGPNNIILQGASESYLTLTNASSTTIALPFQVGDRQYAYLGDTRANSNLDFKATTFAVGTTCQSISKACNLEATQYCPVGGCSLGSATQKITGLAYNCSPNLYGDLLNATGTPWTNGSGSTFPGNFGLFTEYFEHPNYATALTQSGGHVSLPGPKSDFYFATGAVVSASDSLAAEPDAVQDVQDGSYGFLLSCEVNVHVLQYTYINGTFGLDNLTPANVSLANNILWTFFYTPIYAINSLESAFIRGAQLSNTSQQLANSYAQRYSQTALSMIAGITSPRTNLAEQSRQHLLVTQLPKAPFFTLLALNAIYVLLGTVLATIAYTGRPSSVRDVQARLTIAGLVAALLEKDTNAHSSKSKCNGIESLFEEKHGHSDSRVAILRDERGRWIFEKIGMADEKGYSGDVIGQRGSDEAPSPRNASSAHEHASLLATDHGPDHAMHSTSNRSTEQTSPVKRKPVAATSNTGSHANEPAVVR